ncbi:MAG: DNA glycosylase AlkZ-like family protein [Ilumatobacteraceae bacterium]
MGRTGGGRHRGGVACSGRGDDGAADGRSAGAGAAALVRHRPEVGRTVGLSTRILFLLGTQGRIARGKPMGTWVSGQYRWVPIESFAAEGFGTADPAAARQGLVRRWLATYGPGTTADVQWWTGWTKGQTVKTLADIGAVEVELDSESDQRTGWMVVDDRSAGLDEPAGRPWVALLPGLDPTVMGWKQRQWYVGDHTAALFDRNGNAGPTVWADGRIVGGWTQTKDGDVRIRLLEPVTSGIEDAVALRASELRDWLGPIRITHRFRSPLDIELASG